MREGAQGRRQQGEEITVGSLRARSYWMMVWVRLRRDPVSMVCGVILILIALASIFAPWLAPHDPYQTSVFKRLAPIGSPNYLLGADELGRD
ncbi:MAG: hypothetical protein HYU44_17345, partial [Betaproteobacteria bacterium]|nr:hypothetical protein [Betaproteobacteria bacterium]